MSVRDLGRVLGEGGSQVLSLDQDTRRGDTSAGRCAPPQCDENPRPNVRQANPALFI